MKIECTLPYASLEINGIAFVKTEAGTVVSAEEVSEEVAAHFLAIDGYREFTGKVESAKTEPEDDKDSGKAKGGKGSDKPKGKS